MYVFTCLLHGRTVQNYHFCTPRTQYTQQRRELRSTQEGRLGPCIPEQWYSFCSGKVIQQIEMISMSRRKQMKTQLRVECCTRRMCATGRAYQIVLASKEKKKGNLPLPPPLPKMDGKCTLSHTAYTSAYSKSAVLQIYGATFSNVWIKTTDKEQSFLSHHKESVCDRLELPALHSAMPPATHFLPVDNCTRQKLAAVDHGRSMQPL